MTLPSITDKQKEILALLYRFRFLNRIQIQQLLKHKTHNRINAWLKDLTDKNYTGRITDNSSTINNTPAIYYLSLNGIKFIKTQKYCEKAYIAKRYKESSRSDKFMQQCLFIADIYLDLLEKYGRTNEFEFHTQSDYSIEGIIKEIFPHFVFRKGKNQGYYVAEIFPQKPRFYIFNRIKQYIFFFTEGEWVKQEEPPTILLICPNEDIEKYVIKKVKIVCREENVENIILYSSTQIELIDCTFTSNAWYRIELE